MPRHHLLAFTLLCGCAPTWEPQAVESWGRWEEQFSSAPEWPNRLIVVMDDDPSEDGVALRHKTLAGLRSSLRFEYGAVKGRGDPSAWRPLDLAIVVAHPSAPVTARLVGPSDMTALQLRTNLPTNADLDALVDATAVAAAASMVAAGTYEPIDAAHDAAQLMTGFRPPADAHEAQLAAAVDVTPSRVRVVVASARDDASPLPVGSYALPPSDASARWFEIGALLPAVAGETCPRPVDDSSRLAAWVQAEFPYDASPQASPCDDDEVAEGGIFSRSYLHGNGPCASRALAMEPGGKARCHITVKTLDLGPCAGERGWIDPRGDDGTRRPTTTITPLGLARVCEVRQLEGAALESCRFNYTCDGCGSGFCRTEVPELGSFCGEGEHELSLRFPGGAVFGATGIFDIACALVTP